MTTPVKKRVRRAKSTAKKAMPLSANMPSARKMMKAGAIGAGALIAGKTLFSAFRFVAGTALVIAAAIAAASLVPKPVQRQIASNLRDGALSARDAVMRQADAFNA